jgi:hypothetical protein
MDMQEPPTTWTNEAPPAAPEHTHQTPAPVVEPVVEPSPAPVAAPQASRLWRRVAAGGLAVALLVAAGAIGYVVGDDADQVSALRRANTSLEHDVKTIQDDLNAAVSDRDAARAKATALETQVSSCIDATASYQLLLTAVDAMSAAYDSFQATSPGSPEEGAAGVTLDNAARDVLGVARSTHAAAADCAGPAPT